MDYYQVKLDDKIIATHEYDTMIEHEHSGPLTEGYHHYLIHVALDIDGKR